MRAAQALFQSLFIGTSSPPTVRPILDLANVVINARGVVQLTDFGLARQFSSASSQAMTRTGTPRYQSPEIIRGLPYSAASDIWAFGCLMYQCATGNTPFTGKSTHDLEENIKLGLIPEFPISSTNEPFYSLPLRRLIRYSCFRYVSWCQSMLVNWTFGTTERRGHFDVA